MVAMQTFGRRRMRSGRTATAVAGATAAVAALSLTLTACGGGADPHQRPRHAAKHLERADTGRPGKAGDRAARPALLPGVSERLQQRIPASARQAVAVYGKGRDSAESEVRLYARARAGAPWMLQRS
jgi:hypothetical protein